MGLTTARDDRTSSPDGDSPTIGINYGQHHRSRNPVSIQRHPREANPQSTPKGTGILKGDQATARSCYITSLRRGTVPEALTIEDPREEKDGMSPIEELTQVALNPGSPDRLVSIGSLLNLKL